MKGESSSTSSIKSTRGLLSAVGRPPPEVSRPKETSSGRGLGRCCDVVSSFGGGEASGELEGEGEEAPSGRCEDMFAVAVRVVLQWLRRAQRGLTLVAYSCKGHARRDWAGATNFTGCVEMSGKRGEMG